MGKTKISETTRHQLDDQNASAGHADVRMDQGNWFAEAHVNTAAIGADGMFKSEKEAANALADKLEKLAGMLRKG